LIVRTPPPRTEQKVSTMQMTYQSLLPRFTQPLQRALFLGLVCLGMNAAAASDASGSGPIKLVVPFGAGGPTDQIARKIAQKLSEGLGRTIIVDNKVGAGGSIATTAVVRSEPDGATILFNSSAMAIDPVLRRNLPFDVLRDLTPVTTAVVSPLVILVNPQLPVKNISEFVSYAKAHPGKLNFGSGGAGSSLHMTTEQFALAAGIKLVHVPYKGGSESIVAAIANNIQVVVNPMPSAIQYAKNGHQLRALAVTSAGRSANWPELPTVAQSGVKGLETFDSTIWYQFYVPSKTPKAIVDSLNSNIRAALQSEEVSQWLQSQGMEASGDTPEQAGQRLRSEIERWSSVAKKTGLRIE
jgi:tripartite-type tricarboxylate transporter receptor subunit TctC